MYMYTIYSPNIQCLYSSTLFAYKISYQCNNKKCKYRHFALIVDLNTNGSGDGAFLLPRFVHNP